jgi:Zn-dependent protease
VLPVDDHPPKNRGLTVRVFKTPVTIHWTFLVLLAVFAFATPRPFPYGLTFGLVVLVSVLIHEAGHAIAFGAFGRRSRIVINGLAGLTITRADPPLRDGPAIVTSLAGPFAGMVVGLLALWGYRTGMGSNNELTRVVITDAIFVNLGWGMLNLIPMLPLDGGQVMQRLSNRVAPDRASTFPYVISIGVAALIAVSALLWMDRSNRFVTTIAIYLMIIVAVNVALLRQHRADADVDRRQAAVDEAMAHLSDPDPSQAIAALEQVVATERSQQLFDPAALALSWALVWRNSAGDAERVVQLTNQLAGRADTSLVSAAASIRLGRRHEGMALMARGFGMESTEPPAWYINRTAPTATDITEVAGWIDQMNLGERHQGLGRLGVTLEQSGRRADAASVRSMMMRPVQRA